MKPEPKLHRKKLLGTYLISCLIAAAAAYFPNLSVPMWVQGLLWGIGLLSLFVAFYRLHLYGQWLASQP